MARPASDLKIRICRAAREEFLARGVDGASLRAIASAAGSNIGMVYYYFPSKDDLFLGVVEVVYKALLADVAESLQGPSSLPEKMRELYARIWRMSEDEYTVVRLVMREAMVSAERVRRLGKLFAQGHVPLLLAALQAGVGEGTVRDDLPQAAMLVVTVALGMMPALVWRVVGERLLPDLPVPPPEEVAALFAGILVHGIGDSPPVQRPSQPQAHRPAHQPVQRVPAPMQKAQKAVEKTARSSRQKPLRSSRNRTRSKPTAR